MISWSKDELRKIAEADDLHISPFRDGGVTLPGEVPWQPIPQPDDRRPCPLRDSQGDASARNNARSSMTPASRRNIGRQSCF
jgi:hypothetical protein